MPLGIRRCLYTHMHEDSFKPWTATALGTTNTGPAGGAWSCSGEADGPALAGDGSPVVVVGIGVGAPGALVRRGEAEGLASPVVVAAVGDQGGVDRRVGPADRAGVAGDVGEVGGGVLGPDDERPHAERSGLADNGAGQHGEEVATSPPVIREVAGGLVAGDEHDAGPGTQAGNHCAGGGEASEETSGQKVGHRLHRPALCGREVEREL